MKKVFIFLSFCFFVLSHNSTLSAQEPIDLLKYYPLDIGNTWKYGKATEDKANINSLVTVESMSNEGKKDIYVIKDSDEEGVGNYLYVSISDGNIYLHKMMALDDKNLLVFKTPLVIFSGNLKLDEELKSSSEIEIYDPNGTLVNSGSAEAKIRLEKIGEVVIGEKKFHDCAKLLFSFSQNIGKSYVNLVQRSWFAKDIGKIKEIGTIINYDKEQKNFSYKLRLIEATIKGKII